MSDSTGLSGDMIVNQFCSLLESNANLTPEQFFQKHSAAYAQRYAIDVVIADIRARISNERPLDLESYFVQFPQLNDHDQAWRILDAAEPWLVEHEGSDWKQAWQNRFTSTETTVNDPHTTGLNNAAKSLNFDALQRGERVLHFEIQQHVGSGTYGVVYLASNVKLARDVALKITPQGGNEGRALARLNHTNVVRVFGQHEVGAKRLLEMEYVNGSSLDKWICACQQNGEQQGTVKDGDSQAYRNWAAEYSSNSISSESHESSALPVSIRSPAQVAVWITLQLANGLAHAHQRGILHQDIKPANVLVDSQGKPLLTDFNVAFIDGQSRREGVGGTVNYMSPEHLRAYCSGDPESVDSIDSRSDIYSLGIVLLELLGGDKLWGLSVSDSPQTIATDLLAARHEREPRSIANLQGVNQGLAAIVEKSLQPDTSKRYQTTSELATDLSNWLSGRNNTYADNPSLLENALRLVRRRKLEFSAMLAAFTVLAASLCGWAAIENSRLDNCERLLSEAESSLEKGRGAVAAENLGVAKNQLDQLWISNWFQHRRLERNVELAKRCSEDIERHETFRFSSLFGQASLLSVHQNDQQDIQLLVEEGLKSYGVMSDPDWQTQPPFSELSDRRKSQVAENITELMLVSIIHGNRVSDPDESQWARVIERLPSEHRKFQIFQQIKEGKQPEPLPPSNDGGALDSFEMYLHGVWSTCEQLDENAMAWYSASLENQPAEASEKFWLRYRVGLSAQRLGLPQKAISHYNVCLGMKPDFAWLPFNIALVHVETGDVEKAKHYLLRTIHLDSKMLAAYQALATLHLESDEFEQVARICKQAHDEGISSPELTRLAEIARSKPSR